MFLMRFFLLLLSLPLVAFGQRFQEGIHPLAETPNWSLASRTGLPSDGIALFAGSDLLRMERDGSLVPLPVPSKMASRGFQSLHQNGSTLAAVWNTSKGRTFGYLDMKDLDKGWIDSPLAQNSYSYVTCLGVDPGGRMFRSLYATGVLEYQKEPGGNMESYLCEGAESGRMQHLVYAVAEKGAVWFVTQNSLSHDYFKPMSNALQFKDGVITSVDLSSTNSVPMSVLPLPGDHVFISLRGEPGLLLNASTAKPAPEGAVPGFDPAAFGDHDVFQWAFAPDGTLWMLSAPPANTAADLAERKEGRFHRLWRWDGVALEAMFDGVDQVRSSARSYEGNIHADIAASSRSRVQVGTVGAGIFTWEEGRGGSWLDWRHDIPWLHVKRLYNGGHFTLFQTENNELHTVTGDRRSFKETINPEIREFQTTLNLETAPDGTLWSVLAGETFALHEWDGTRWQQGPELPLPQTNFSGFSFDSLGRAWVSDRSFTSKVCVVDQSGEWTCYDSQREAYAEEVAKQLKTHPDYQISVGNRTVFRPLVLKSGEIWYLDPQHRLHILRDGVWWDALYTEIGSGASFRAGPFANRRGLGRILQGQNLMAFDGKKLVVVKQGVQNQNQARGGMWQQFGFGQVQFGDGADGWQLAGNGLRDVYRQDPRFKEYGRVMTTSIDAFGNEWVVAGKHLLGVRGTNIVEVSLAGSAANSFMPVNTIRHDEFGGLFLRIGSRSGASRHSRWVYVRPKLPRHTFRATADTSQPNRIVLAVENLSDADDLEVVARIDGGPWRSAEPLYPVEEGMRNVLVRCRERGSRLYFSDTISLDVEVTGNLDEVIKALVTQLGDKEYAKRREAIELLARVRVQAQDALLEATKAADPEVRQAALGLLRGR